GPGALERGRRLVEGAELVAGNPEVHEGVEPVRILGEYPLEGAGRVGVASSRAAATPWPNVVVQPASTESASTRPSAVTPVRTADTSRCRDNTAADGAKAAPG